MEKQLRTDFKKIIDSSNFSEKEIIKKEKYLNKFVQNGFPGKKNEDWKFLDLNQAIKSNIENLDYFNETDLIKKFVVSNRIQPIVMGIFCNSPFRESKYNNLVSNRIYTWQDTDDQRCGIKRSFLNKNFSIEEYVDFVLEVKNYFLKINGKQYDTTDYTFNELLTKNTANKDLSNYNISIQDWINHLSTIFTEVRLKSYIELRGADAGKWEMICALPAFWVGILYDDENLEIGRDITDSGGRFFILDVPRKSSIIVVEHPNHITQRILLIPGDHTQIIVTLTEGEGDPQETDMRGESFLSESVLITSIIGAVTLFAGIAGILGGIEAYNGKSHFRTQFLAYLGLWSQGLMFIGPLFILMGMGLSYLSRKQFGLVEG